MGRKQAMVLAEHVDTDRKVTTQVIDNPRLFAVLYNGKPINIKIVYHNGTTGPVYRSTVFNQFGYCKNLAEELNRKFTTDKFTFHEVTPE